MPDAIAILTAGTVSYQDPITGTEHFRSTTECDSDAGGILWGSIRVEAGALLAAQYPEALVIVCGGGRRLPPSHARVMQEELEIRGVRPDRIILEERSTNTQEQLTELRLLAQAIPIRSVLLVSNEYHIPRIETFLLSMQEGGPSISCVTAESVVVHADPSRSNAIQDIHASPVYILRLQREAQGVEAINAGTYSPRPPAEKKEI